MATISQIKVGSTSYDLKATLLKPISDTTSVSGSTWNIPSGSKQVWGIRFSDNTLQYTPEGGSATTITDTGDWVMWLTPNATSNVATLNMRIDGTYYGNFNGTLSGSASKLGSSTVGATDRPIYLSSGTASQTTYRMAATNATATTARAITDNLETGIWYVNGTNSTDLYSQSDGIAFVNKYNDNWIGEIYQDYRTGQLAIRGKNNGTWQAWRKVLDSSNYNTWAAAKSHTHSYLPLSGGTMSGNITFGDSNIGIQRVGRSMSWNKGRDGAILKSTSLSGYSPLWSVKTNNGSWDIGAYDHSSYTDQLIFTYITDTNYNGTNATTRQVIIRPNGDAGFGLRNISFGTAAPSGGSNGDVYIQYS